MLSLRQSFRNLEGIVLLAALAATPTAASVRCLPTCSSTDGRFMAIAGTGFDTLSPPEMDLSIAVPAGSTTFDIGVFDGDGGEYDPPGNPLGEANWDSGQTALFEYELFADPYADGAGLTPVELEPGSTVILSSEMPDNAWRDFTVPTGPEALSPSGNYFYVLRIRLAIPTVTTLNAFKVRTSATLSGLTFDPVARPFSYIAPWTTLSDLSVIYPSFPAPTPTTYDGTFRFYFDVPVSQDEITIWDGDIDHGKYDLSDPDTDDPDTPPLILPPWSTLDTLPESAKGPGSPADDTSSAEVYILRTPSVRYDLIVPGGPVLPNDNPSGNQEWEKFTVSTSPPDLSVMDHSVASLPPGTYTLAIHGVDMLNLNALLPPFRLLCVEETGAPCVPLRPFLAGDTVFRDTDGDGTQDPGEPGIAGVTMQLYDANGFLLGTTATDASGHYSFGVENATYEVRVAPSNFTTGPLVGHTSTTGGNSQTGTVDGDNELGFDFGYKPPAVCKAGTFKDTFTTASFSNNDGTLSWSGAWVESDVAGAGASSGNVTVGTPVSGYMIFRDSPDTGTQPSAARQANLSGFASATLTVDFHIRGVEADDAAVIEVSGNGGSSYTVLETLTGYTGTYISSRTFDISAYRASNTRIRFRIANLYGGDDDFFKIDQVRIDAGCTPPPAAGSAGNRVWKDVDGDGVQDSGEPGLNGVIVQLLNSGGTVLATQTTSGDGNHSFGGLAAGTYKVQVVSSTLPSGYTPTYDLDGTGTAHVAAFTLAAGQSRTDVDFGYRPAPTCTAGYFKDLFTNASFSNNDGTLSWSGAWVESDVAGAGVSSGNVTVGTPVSGYMILRDSPDTGTQPSAARQANLSGFASATLTVSFHIRGVEADDAAVIEVSNNGGTSYTVLETLTGYTDTYISSRTYNISAYKASNTRVRFRIKTNYGGSDDFFKVDWVKIDGACQ